MSLVDEIENCLRPNVPSVDPLETGTVVQSKREKEREKERKEKRNEERGRQSNDFGKRK